MKIESAILDVESSLPQTHFTIKCDAKAFQMLSKNVYTRPYEAIVREISTNAWDSHVEAGNLIPFDVHLPTIYEQWFSVRDYGTGMSDDQVKTLYTQYFSSTRSESNDYTGAIGIGRMSVLSISDSFTLESFFCGRKTTYTIYKNKDGIPALSTLCSEETDEPNGCRVYVTSARYNDFYQAAERVYPFFDVKPNINVDSVRNNVENFFQDWIDIDGAKFTLDNNISKTLLVMGNVAYPLPELMVGTRARLKSIIYFDIGDFNFNPGREEIIDGFDKIKSKIFSTNRIIINKIQEMIDACPNTYEAFKLSCSSYFVSPLYRGKTIPTSFKKEVYFIKYNFGQLKKRKITDIPNGDIEFFWKKRGYVSRIDDYVRNNKSAVILIESDEDIDAIGIDSSYVKDPSTLPKKTIIRGKAKLKQVYELVGYCHANNFQNWDNITELPDGEKVYLPLSRYKITSKYFERCSEINGAVRHINMPTIYGLSPSFIRSSDFDDTFIHLDDYLVREYTRLVKGKSKKYIKPDFDHSLLRIDHPEINAIKNYFVYDKLLESAQRFIHIEDSMDAVNKWKEITKKYPLLGKIYATPKEILEYMELIDGREKVS